MLRDGYGIDEQRLGLSHLGLVIIARLGARDADVDVSEVWDDIGWPWIAQRFGGEALACRRSRPALAGNLRKRARRIAVHNHLDVVKGLERRTGGVDAGGIVHLVLRGVPAPDGEIESAGERHRIVDHNDLLMLRAAERHDVVET